MALAISSFTPSGGPTTGGTKVVITGTQLTDAENWLFGSVPAQIDSTATNTATSMTLIAPPISNSGTLVVKIVAVDSTSTGVIVVSTGSYTYTTVSVPQLGTTVASKWILKVDSSGLLDGSSLIPCRGMTNFVPGLSQVTQDDSDYDSGIYGSDVVTQQKMALTATFDRKVASGNVEDPGQKILRLAGALAGASNQVFLQWSDRNGTPGEAYTGIFLVKWSEKGGATSDKSSVDVTFMGRGARNTITNPN